jgi:hypothetical protein
VSARMGAPEGVRQLDAGAPGHLEIGDEDRVGGNVSNGGTAVADG